MYMIPSGTPLQDVHARSDDDDAMYNRQDLEHIRPNAFVSSHLSVIRPDPCHS